MLFNLAQTLRSLTTSPVSTAVDQAHRMARGRLEAGGPAVSARDRFDHGWLGTGASPLASTVRGSSGAY